MKMLITGGAGFIGSNLALNLAKQHNVWVIDNMSSGRHENVSDLIDANCSFFHYDYGDKDTAQLIRLVRPDVVFHFAAIPRVLYSIENPIETNENNVQKTLRLLTACQSNVGRFIFSSSSSVNGDTDILPTPENIKRKPKSPYALQKAIMEDYCRLWSELYKLDTVSLRYFNVFGPRQYGDSAYSTVISAWCNNIKNGLPLRLDGSGEQSRDFCYVDDVVNANILASQLPEICNGEIYNVAGGNTVSVNDIKRKFQQKFNCEFEYTPTRQGDVFATHAELTKAANELGYHPNIQFDEGLQRTFEWWGI